MRRFIGTAAVLASAALVVAPAAVAGPVTGSTELATAATSGEPLTVRVTLSGVYPVVPYEFILENRCWFRGKGPVDSVERYPLIGPWFLAPGGGSYSDEAVDLASVPTGARCTVSVLRGSSPVKGSATTYTVD